MIISFPLVANVPRGTLHGFYGAMFHVEHFVIFCIWLKSPKSSISVAVINTWHVISTNSSAT